MERVCHFAAKTSGENFEDSAPPITQVCGKERTVEELHTSMSRVLGHIRTLRSTGRTSERTMTMADLRQAGAAS